MPAPQSRFYESHGLRLHYADWGNEGAPPLILVHGGRDHCRSWDVIARSLQPHFHVVAPDLRGHGDSDWTRGGSYALTEYVYDLAQLIRTIAASQVTLVGHSMGGMVSLIFSGSFPEQVSKLVVTLLLNAGESFLAGARAAGLERYFPQARVETIAGAGHWLQHDKPQEVLGEIRKFLELTEQSAG
ncbi:hypothetical protein SG09_37480 [Bradyrhizobium ottawaense]|uniref:alpha/beta fold hydrolase n=1 Tax=Bradyrhizobium ottawaense TaxID=931866 RepID=UPI001260F99C|nr:alpha/beta hydrolase [Bradyrhizobium ottawaense]BBO04398.1 hypothetical protein SG09_37480 [Bradyrhizobium ottawaense]